MDLIARAWWHIQGTLDVTLELKAIGGNPDNKNRGTITMQLNAIDNSKAGVVAAGNTLQDIKFGGIDHSSAVADSNTSQVLGVSAPAAAAQSDFVKPLWGVMSKLDLFVQIVDKTAKVCMVNCICNTDT